MFRSLHSWWDEVVYMFFCYYIIHVLITDKKTSLCRGIILTKQIGNNM